MTQHPQPPGQVIELRKLRELRERCAIQWRIIANSQDAAGRVENADKTLDEFDRELDELCERLIKTEDRCSRLLAEREDLIKALAERRRCFDYLLVEHHKRYCSGPLETCILADCCEAREAIANADALTRVRAHDEGTTT